MMIGTLQNHFRLQALRASAGRETQRIGIVTNYDPTSYTAKASIQPEDVATGWLPIAAAYAGNGWGMFAAPTIGQKVEVTFFDGDLSTGIIQCAMFDDLDRPMAVPSGEFWLFHASGQGVKLTNDGKLALTDGHGATISLNGDGSISSAGTWNHTGTFTATTDVVGGGKSLKTHVHSGVSSGGSNTGQPV